MTTASFVIMELASYVLAAICIRHIWRNGGRATLIIFFTAALFGFGLELIEVNTPDTYCYGRFMVMLPLTLTPPADLGPCFAKHVPLWAFVGWAMTFYVVMQTSDKLNLPWKLRPVLDGLLAVSVDWVMDPVAVKLGFWTWAEPGRWFGIPLYNYVGWMLTVGGLSLLVRIAERKVPYGSNGWLGDILTPLIAAAIAFGAVLGVLWLYEKANTTVQAVVLALLLVASIITLGRHLPSAKRDNQWDWVVIAIPMFFHIAFGIGLLVSGLADDEPMLILVGAITLPMAACVYTMSYWRANKNAVIATQTEES